MLFNGNIWDDSSSMDIDGDIMMEYNTVFLSPNAQIQNA